LAEQERSGCDWSGFGKEEKTQFIRKNPQMEAIQPAGKQTPCAGLH
jgi:hypothetical protein